jgi:hypothetical protein
MCQTASCDGSKGVCVYQNVSDGTLTPGFTQTKGDCLTHVCMGGMDTPVVDDSDVPIPMSDCDDTSCSNGMKVHSFTNHPLGAPCSTFMGNKPGFCDGMGNCHQCTMANQCPGMTTDCGKPICNASGACSIMMLMPAGTATVNNPQQVVGDCHTVTCDANGNAVNQVDDKDVPPSANPCLKNVCMNGSLGTPTVNVGKTCGTGTQTCNAAGQCICTMTSDCMPPATCTGTPMICTCTPTTCGARTCDTLADGCNGVLNCNDGMKDGTETDVDCGGLGATNSTCDILCPQGKHCNVTSDCASGLFCVDGVCCNEACTGTCQACSAAAKGAGVDGVCGAVAAGSDPHNQCPMQPATMSCGQMGGCDGAGKCAPWPNGTACTTPTCPNMMSENNPKTCVGGVCTMPAVNMQMCAPYVCLGTNTNGMCATSCGITPYTDTNCAPGYYCDGAGQGTCQKKLTTGACNNNDQCASGQCLSGACCATMCKTAAPCGATACAMTTGACEYAPALTNCAMGKCTGMLNGLGVCDGLGTCQFPGNFGCPNGCSPTGCTACGMDNQCTNWGYCSGATMGMNNGTCMPKGQLGAMCTADNQCLMGHCRGGQCSAM